MALSAGTRLGQYEIVGLIGAGGMGEVYRARDSKLKREVAINTSIRGISKSENRQNEAIECY
jgi:eukaryotic-like serine/threonine-protein kinase